MAVSWGILSTARINEWVLTACAGSPMVEFHAVASRSHARAQSFADRHAIPRAYGSYDALLSDPEIQAVYVSLPNSLHIEWAERALLAGKHVLCEKPLGLPPAEVESAVAVADARGLVFAEAFMYRHHPQTACVRDLIAAGTIGDLAFIHATLTFTLPPADRGIRLDPTLGGGALMDVGCYCVNAARLFAGEPVSVFGEAITDNAPVDTRFFGTLAFSGGVRAHFDCGMDQPRRDRLELVGTEGAVVVSDPWHCRAKTVTIFTGKGYDDGRSTAVPIDPEGRHGLSYGIHDAYRLEFEALSQAVAGGRPLPAAHADAIGQARTMHALATSARTGAQVRLGPTP